MAREEDDDVDNLDTSYFTGAPAAPRTTQNPNPPPLPAPPKPPSQMQTQTVLARPDENYGTGFQPATKQVQTMSREDSRFNAGIQAYQDQMTDHLMKGEESTRIDYNNLLRDTGQRAGFYDQLGTAVSQRAAPQANFGRAYGAFDNANTLIGQGGRSMQAGETFLGTAGVHLGNQAQTRGAIGAATNADAIRQQQQDQIDYLRLVQSGQAGPSVAQMQGQQNVEQAIAGQHALAAGARGPEMAGALNTAILGAGNTGAQGARDAAMLRAREQQAAGDQLAGILAGTRQGDLATGDLYSTLAGQDISRAQVAGGLAGEGRQIALGYGALGSEFAGLGSAEAQLPQFQAGLDLESRQSNDQLMRDLYGMSDAQTDRQYQAKLEAERLRTENFLKWRAIQQGKGGGIDWGRVLGTAAGATVGFVAGGGPPGAAAGGAAGGELGSAIGNA